MYRATLPSQKERQQQKRMKQKKEKKENKEKKGGGERSRGGGVLQQRVNLPPQEEIKGVQRPVTPINNQNKTK